MLKKSCIKLLLVLTFLTFLIPTQFKTAYAFGYDGQHWFEGEMGVSINLLFPTVAFDALERSVETWHNAGSSFRFYYVGLTVATTSFYEPDFINVVNHGNFGLIEVVASSFVWYYPSTGQIIECDLVYNTSYPWSLSGQAGMFDFQSSATHELGHAFHLKDLYGSTDTEKTMYGIILTGSTKKRTLHQDDVDGIKYIYP